ncbi:GH92 family glycosyl hydrolase [Luteimonas sp. BDR2-5]|uniref:GH92 family glycosyl hydrolase n=1 Tax=Proluteimonas luteida TaxID=2878685 RepID=UPI001E57A5D9|nr:GH92 family glycosyl hydrolase [Luteimonas sp. BDR2-5]MCD9026959.1 GH92 family glycosyl hydrolase [Luteimonas sp. BDR2-5]
MPLLAATLALAGVAGAGHVHAQDFRTSFEPGEAAPAAPAQSLRLTVGNGPDAPYAARAGVGYSGLHALRFEAGAAARTRLFDVDIPVEADTTLSWLVLPEIVDGDTTASTHVSLDLLLDDGSRLSALAARDQHGARLGAAAQGGSNTLYPQQWARKAVRVGDVDGLRGRRIVAIELEAAPPGAVPARGWLDDIAIASVPRAGHRRPSDWVLTTRGTQSNGRFSRGNNFPATALPHGFNFWTPVTDAGALNWLYRWSEHNDAGNRPQLQALALSHQTSPWMGDRQTFQVMPSDTRGVPESDRTARALAFSRDNELARPHHYRVAFDNGIVAEVAPTDHAALFRFAFPAGGDANLLFDNVDARGGLVLDAQAQTLSGFTDVRSGLSTGATRMFVVARFDRPWRASGTLETGRPTGYVKFDAGDAGIVQMRIATSLISVEQAWHNLALELGEGPDAAAPDFDAVRERAQAAWDGKLGIVEVEGASDDQRTTLYSNLYRLFLYPNSGHENAGTAEAPDWRYASQNSWSNDNAEGNPLRSFAPVRDGRVYVNNGFWDTFRTTWPAYALLTPDTAGELVQGFLEQYRAGGWVARWSSPGYANLMVGTSSDVAFADAWLKGVDGFDPEEAYAAALKNATVVPPSDNVGRKGLARSSFRGYADTSVHEGMSWTLEGALNDFGIANMAQRLATQADSPAARRRYADEAAYFRQRAAGYVHLFDPAVGFFQGRDSDGGWRLDAAGFDPRVWGHDYTEANAWTFAFTAAHDGQGLANLYGGRDALAAKLDAFFATPETADPAFAGSYGGVIHEMTEARDVRMGMYAHSNQPAHHIPWLYLHAGQPWKTQRITREVLQRLYLGSEIGQGYPGDEDNGEMSAWYLFAALGLYPLRMGAPEYVIGAPLFERATVHLGGGRTLVVNAPGNTPENVYVQSLQVDGRDWDRPWIRHADIAGGAVLDFRLGDTPSDWGSDADALPPSLTGGDTAPRPWVDLLAPPRARAGTHDGSAANALLDDDATTTLQLVGEARALTLDAGRRITPLAYTLTSGAAPIAATGWVLEAMDGSGAWIELDRRSDEAFRWPRQTRPFRIDAPSGHDRFRIRFDGNGRLQLAEIELLGAPETAPVSLSPRRSPQ